MSELEREEEVVEALKRSKERVNYVYPVIIDSATGEIVDGRHRKRADPTWPEKKVEFKDEIEKILFRICLLYTSPSPRDAHESRMPSSA